MPDFPNTFIGPAKSVISSHGFEGLLGDQVSLLGLGGAVAQTWPVANKAVFFPFTLEAPALAQKMAVRVSVQSGNLDVGIYTEAGAKVVTSGTTPVAVAGLQVIDITDTWLQTGLYFMALAVDNITASIFGQTVPVAQTRICGVQEMATAFVLPATVTFANLAAAKQPLVLLQCGNATL